MQVKILDLIKNSIENKGICSVSTLHFNALLKLSKGNYFSKQYQLSLISCIFAKKKKNINYNPLINNTVKHKNKNQDLQKKIIFLLLSRLKFLTRVRRSVESKSMNGHPILNCPNFIHTCTLICYQ